MDERNVYYTPPTSPRKSQLTKENHAWLNNDDDEHWHEYDHHGRDGMNDEDELMQSHGFSGKSMNPYMV